MNVNMAPEKGKDDDDKEYDDTFEKTCSNDDDSYDETRERNRYFRYTMGSNFFFLIASILYCWLAVIDYEWTIKAQDIPQYVMRADDDVAWVKSPAITRVEDRRRSLNQIRKVGGSRLLYRKLSNLFSQYIDAPQQQGLKSMEETGKQENFSDSGFVTSMFRELSLDSNLADIDNNSDNINTVIDEKDGNKNTFFNFDTTVKDGDTKNVVTKEENQEKKMATIEEDATDEEGEIKRETNIEEESNEVHTIDEKVITNSISNDTTIEENGEDFTVDGKAEHEDEGVQHIDEETIPLLERHWSSLSNRTQQAASTLGYNENNWGDKEIALEVLNLYWDELTAEEKNAAIELYNADEASWNGWNVTGTTNWDNYGWNGLPDNVQEAATVLNYTQAIWDNNVELNHPWWENLSKEEQSAVILFGYDEDSWNDFENIDWANYDWSGLPIKIKKAAKNIGFNKSLWNNDAEPSTNFFSWKELMFSQQESANLLGYTEETWNASDDYPDTVTATSKDSNTDDKTVDTDDKTDDTDDKTNDTDNNIDGTNISTETKYNITVDSGIIDDKNDTNWGDMAWTDLSDDARAAAKLLGHRKNTWDNKMSAYTDSMYWSELTPDQQEAATLFGYEQETWDNGDNAASATTAATTTVDEQFGTSTTTNKTPNYDDFYWNELPQIIQDAAGILGYNKSIWDTGGASNVDDLSWSQLSPEQQNAAILMGYNQEKWDDADGSDDTVASSDWENMNWSQLPQEVKDAAVVLGYTEDIWTNGGTAFTDDLYWAQLTPEQQAAGSIFEYTQESWDTAPDTSSTHSVEKDNTQLQATWNTLGWDNFPAEVQKAWEVLGYNQQLWDNGNEASIEKLAWDQLSQEEKDAATYLGYDQDKWDIATWDDYYWAELPDNMKKQAVILGYDENSWDNSLWVYTEDMSWDELTFEQQYAANILGYDPEKWNADINNDVEEVDVSYWDNSYWRDIPLAIKAVYAAFGYDENLWNTGGMPSTELKDWDELTLHQQKAGVFLGYTQESWDFDDGSIIYWADDDYLFEVQGTDSSVSLGMIVYFFAALGFAITGMLDWTLEPSCCNMFMVLAGFSGVASAIIMDKYEDWSMIMNSISVHLFFLEFLKLLWYHFKRTDVLAPHLMHLLIIADILFGVGAIKDVTLSYFYLDVSAQWNIHIAHSSIAAAVSWLICALIDNIATIMEYKSYKADDNTTTLEPVGEQEQANKISAKEPLQQV